MLLRMRRHKQKDMIHGTKMRLYIIQASEDADLWVELIWNSVPRLGVVLVEQAEQPNQPMTAH